MAAKLIYCDTICLGCVGVLMADTGLEEVLKAGFGDVACMLTGKKYCGQL